MFENNTTNLNQTEKEEFKQFLISFQDVFARNKSQIGRCKLVKHTIDTGDHTPINTLTATRVYSEIPVRPRVPLYGAYSDI
ncbi:hypothetical protein WN55_00758 [Dufourea novaeangliae]|uniref:Uncharacterized protein n=1 Tax=Dufourea novaeangliae TaxID=178035 RepID=A0A154PB24_DUFNO|nr:hypothetical protein WN55_00758 [Dufourea novaeangliae]